MDLDKKEVARRIIIYLESLEDKHNINPAWKNSTIKTLHHYINDEETAFGVWQAFERSAENCLNAEVLIKVNSFKYLFHASL